jgi:hypothetical protein
MPENATDKRRWFRSKPRGLVQTSGKILVSGRAAPIDCTVVDLSAGGACLALSQVQDLPPRFEFLHGGTKKICTLVWRRGYRLGVSFVASAEKSLSSGPSKYSSRFR